MKKFIVVLIMAVAAMTVNTTKAGATGTEVKNQYVKWGTIPTNFSKSDLISWLKKAMKGQDIPGATVRSNAASYTAVWGEQVYAEVLAAGDDSFITGQASGNEINYALDESGKPSASGYLKQGTPIIGFKRPNGQTIVLAKWGTNGCLNALFQKPTVAVNDGPDPDNKNEKGALVNTNNNVINLFSAEVSWSRGYEIYSHGRSDTKADIFDGMMMAKALSSSCCGTQGTSQGYAGSGTIILASGTTGQTANKKPFVDTWFGQMTSNAAGTALGIGLYNLVDDLFDQNRNWNNWNGSGWNWNTRNAGFIPVHGATGSGWNGGVSGWVGGGIATPGQLLGGTRGPGFPW